MSNHDVLIIGAGPAGLATAGRLRRAGIDFHIVEKSHNIAFRWHHHYDRLHLHTVKRLSNLPFLPLPDEFPRYVPREQLVEYFDTYASTFDIRPEFGVEVKNIRKSTDGCWIVQMQEKTLEASQVIIATGLNNRPKRPHWPGEDIYQGSITHSIDYRNPAPFIGARVLVVGMGNTGAEIALDLSEHHVDTLLSVRGEINVVPRDLNGRPVQETGKILAKFPWGLGDWIGARVQSIYFGDLTRYGLQRSKLPPAVQLRDTGKSPVIDIGTIKAIKKGKIKVVGEVRALHPTGVTLMDDSTLEIDHIITATGYHSCLDQLIERFADMQDRHGYPNGSIGTGYHTGLYFVGFDNYKIGGILGTIYKDSQTVVEHLLNEKR